MSNLRKSREQTKNMIVSAALCALSVIILSLGSLIEVVDLSVAVIASLLCVYAVIEIGGIYPWLIWLVTSIVSALLLPTKTPAVFYALLAGYYPILKEKIERLPTLPAYLLKWGVATVAAVAIWGVSVLFLPVLLEGFETLPLLLALYGGMVVVFFIYDFALSSLITFYFRRLRNRLRVHK
ncbi:MAG: hypothetical protein IJW30_00175 [Clostridia bacterium]|nr:hypothetical protein [Clostridia bacterium]